ncbi:PRD domain-containing protein [Brevibacterium sp. JNUCC-42]|nr:PRD domain-containing protein [Brevibacterium sp. JNUCC-42]
MLIKKVFNNNVAFVHRDVTEMIVMGKGIAFQKKVGDYIDEAIIDKIFVLENENQTSNKLLQLINEIPTEHFELTAQIVQYVKTQITNPISDNIYLTLTDHISFTINRVQKGQVIKNPLFWEIKKFYQMEYELGLTALTMVKDHTGFELPEEEAGSIALHLINAQQDNKAMEETIRVTKVVSDILNIVKYHFGIALNENSINYNRFVTHLRYFAYRLSRNEQLVDEDHLLFEQVKANYPEAFRCTEKIITYLQSNYNKQLTKDDIIYFIIHIHRVTTRELDNQSTGL